MEREGLASPHPNGDRRGTDPCPRAQSMTGFRFVHAADIHLDTPFRARSAETRRALKDAGRRAFRNLIDGALDFEAHALLLAGDVFDGERLSLGTERWFLAELRRALEGGIALVLATGNHDPGSGGARSLGLEWPKGSFHRFDGPRPRVVEIFDPRTGSPVGRVVGCGHGRARETDNLAATFVHPGRDLPSVAMLHTQVEGSAGAEDHRPYAPSTLRDLESLGVDYWALGHVHRRQRVLERPAAWYPGNLQGRHFGECGAKGALLVELLHGEAPRVAFLDCAPVRFERVSVDLSGVRDFEGVRRCARGALDLHLGGDLDRGSGDSGPEFMLRFELRGATPLVDELGVPGALEDLATGLGSDLEALEVDVRDRGLVRPVDLESHRGRSDILGLALEVLEDLQHDDALLSRLAPRHLAGQGRDGRLEALRRLARVDVPGLERELGAALGSNTESLRSDLPRSGTADA